MSRLLHRLLGKRYMFVALVVLSVPSHVAAGVGIGLLALYEPISGGELWRIVVVSQVVVGIDNVGAFFTQRRLLRPYRAWQNGDRTPETVQAAWRAVVMLPRDLVLRRIFPFILLITPGCVYAGIDADLSVPTVAIVAAAGIIALAYGVLMRVFSMEVVLRPVVAEVAADLPAGRRPAVRFALGLRARLLLAFPVLNIVTGLAIGGIATDSSDGLGDIGVAGMLAILGMFALSVALVWLIAHALLQPLDGLRAAAEKVGAGDLEVQVPVVSADEAGELANAFNDMVSGLREREALREAFGSFVAPDVVDRVLRDGTVRSGELFDVTVLMLDVWDFTAFAERAEPQTVVLRLNALWDLVVPVVDRHGGHVNKLLGDGLLAVFGAPEPLRDHADRALACALEVAASVREAYGDELRIGIGLSSGEVVVGTMGGGGRLELGVIGDTVNTASRVEAATRETGDDVLLTGAVRERLGAEAPELVRRDVAQVRGKPLAVDLWAPQVAAGTEASASLRSSADS